MNWRKFPGIRPPLADSRGEPSENSFRKEQDSGCALASQRSPERQSQPRKWSRAFFITAQHLREAAGGLRLMQMKLEACVGHGGKELLKGKEEPSYLCVWKAKGTLFHKINECADFDLLKLLGKTQKEGVKPSCFI